VGVTPLFSMAVTMRDRGDVRPVIFFCANARWDEVVLREKLDDLKSSMPNLTVIHVLQDPPPEWNGKTGRITPDLLKECLPMGQFRRFEYFICGSNPMMDAMEHALLSIGVPYSRINTERFDMV
jgi:ferredoxin-NADP reductase